MQTAWLVRKDPEYVRMKVLHQALPGQLSCRGWSPRSSLNSRWKLAGYSRFLGDVFGAPLVIGG
jgi:hypothetical protein